MARFKSTSPKWHFGQVGNGAKKPYEYFFIQKCLVEKIEISCNVLLAIYECLL